MGDRTEGEIRENCMIGADMLVSHSISGPLFLFVVSCLFVCTYRSWKYGKPCS